MRTYTTEIKEVKVVSGVKCDVCGKEFNNMDSVTMKHGDWGNDSIDSYTNKDYCTLECYKNLAIQFLDNPDYNGYGTSEFDDIEINKLKILMNVNKKDIK